MLRRSAPAAWPAKLPFGGFLSGLFSAKRRGPDSKAARAAKVLALESLERRELLFGSGGSAWISLSTAPIVPEGAPVVVMLKWGDFSSMGGTINYFSGGMSPEVPRDHNLVSGSFNPATASGQTSFVVKTYPDDKGYPEDFADMFTPGANGYSPGEGNPSATAGEYISENSAQERVCTCACGCLNVEASVAPSSGAVVANTGTGGAANTLKYNGLLMPHPIVSVDDTLSSTVSSASDLEVQTILTDLQGNTLWTGSPVYYNAASYTQGQQVHFSQQIDGTGLADGTYEATTYVIEDYTNSASIIRAYGQFVGIENRDNSPYGAGWGLNNVDRLVPQSTGISLFDGSGNDYWFNKEPYDGSYDVPEDRTDIASLVANGDGTYTLTMRDGGKETFGSTGLLATQVDKNNNVQSYLWNADNTLHSVEDQAGRVTTFSYTGGMLSSVADWAGRTTSYVMSNGKLTQITMPDPGHGETQHVTTMGYDSGTGLLTTIADSGGTTALAYNGSREVTKITNPDSTFTSYNVPDSQAIVNTSGGVGTLSNPAPLTYTSSVVGTQTDENGKTSQYSTNAFGETTTSIDAAGTLETLTQFNTAGLPTQITEHPLTGGLPDEVWKLSYDTNFNLSEEDFPDGTKSTWVYNQTFNEPTQYIDPAGRETDYTLDPANGDVLTVTQVSKTQGLANLVTTMTYTPNPTAQGQTPGGLVATTVDPRGIETDDFYNSHGLLTQVVYAKGTSDQASVEYTYDQNDNQASFENELGAITLTTYDNLNHLVERQDPAPDPSQPNVRPTTTWQFDPRGDMVQMVDPRGLTTSYTYGPGSDGDDPDLDKMTQPDPAGGTSYTVTAYGHDNADDVTSITSPSGEIETVGYDADRRPTSDQLPNPVGGGTGGPTSSVVYDVFSNAAQVFDAGQNETDNTFNWRGQVLTSTGPAPTPGAARPEIVETYNADGQELTYQDARGNVTQKFYDDFGRLVKEILPDPDGSGPLTSPVLQWFYDADSNIVGFEDANNHLYQYQFGARNELLKEIDPSPDGVAPSPTTSYQYNAALEQTQVTDPMGRVTQEQWSPNGWLVATIAPNLTTGGPGDSTTTTSDTFDLDGNRISETTPTPAGATGPATTTWTLDDLNRVTLITQPVPGQGQSAPTWQEFYNADSVLTKEIDPLARTQTTTLDGMDRPVGQVGFDGVQTAWAYNPFSEVTSTTIGTGSLAETTTNTWDALGRKTAVQTAAGTTSMAFDLVGNMTSLKDPDQNTTSWVYDNLNRATSETNQLGYSRLFSWDNNSNLIQETDRDGRVRDFTVDNLNRETAEQWMNGGSVVNTIATGYNADGEVTTAADNYSAYAFGYDGQGHLASVDNAGTLGAPHVVLASAYDPAGNRTSTAATIAGVADFINNYSYDTLSRMTSIVQQQQTGGNAVAPKEIDYSYNALGDVTSRVGYTFIGIGPRADITTGTFTYNTLDQLTGLDYTAYGGAQTAGDFGWTFDPLSRVSTFTSPFGTATYGYDNTSQIVSASYTGTNQPPNVSFTWDANGNNAATGNVVSADNEVTNDGTFTYTFDHEGNRATRTRISNAPANDYLTTYTWDYRDRLTDVEFYNNSSVLTSHVHYVYDSFDHMIEEDVDPTGGGTYTIATHNVYDFLGAPPAPVPDQPYGAATPAAIVLQFNVGLNLTARELNGPNLSATDAYFTSLAEGEVSSLTNPDTVQFNLLDNLGSVRIIVDANGAVIDSLNYSAFGQSVYESNAAIHHIYGFAASYSDSQTGLLNEDERWLDPLAGLWLSHDPIGFRSGDVNLNRDVGNSPTSHIDPTGLKARPPVRPRPQIPPTGHPTHFLYYSHYYPGMPNSPHQRAPVRRDPLPCRQNLLLVPRRRPPRQPPGRPANPPKAGDMIKDLQNMIDKSWKSYCKWSDELEKKLLEELLEESQ